MEADSKVGGGPGEGRQWFLKGLRDGVPIGLGYFAVSFTLGIIARNAGMSAVQAGFMSATMLASAGEFAAVNAIVTGASYGEMVITTLVINLRYLLMSSALSQKVRQDKPFFHRFLMAYAVTDEIFAASVSVPGRLDPSYTYGVVSAAAPGWVVGTVLGVLFGMIMPARAMSAMGVALYGMFMAVVIPASKKSRIIAGVVLVSMAASTVFAWTPGISQVSSGFQIIILTILVSGIAAVLFPVKEEKEENDEA